MLFKVLVDLSKYFDIWLGEDGFQCGFRKGFNFMAIFFFTGISEIYRTIFP